MSLNVNLRELAAFEPDWHLVENLLQDYLKELAPWSGAQPDRSGKYQYPYLRHYQTEPDRKLLTVQSNGSTLGFIMTREESDPANGEAVTEIAEFYVVPDQRRFGIGEAALRLLFDQNPGRWRLGVFPENKAALSFWRRTLMRLAESESIEEMPPVGPRERHILFKFIVRSAF